MPALIQFRRDTASNWTSNNPTLADGEFAIESDTTKYKIGDGSTAWTSLAYGGLGSIDTAIIDAKGDLIVGSADNTVARVAVGSNGQVLVADSAQTAGVKWVSQESIVNWHEAVKLGTAAALPNSPTYDNGTSGVGATLTAGSNIRLVVDGANATTGDRVLVQDQSTAAHNGIYDVTNQGAASGSPAAWVLTRAIDFDGSPTGQIKSGESVYVLSGSTNSGQGFVVTSTSDPHTVGTHDITMTQFTGTQAFTAGTTLTITGNTIDHDASGASAGSYGSATEVPGYTVDAQGHLTAASNTTIAIPSTAVTDFTEAVQDVSGAQLGTNGSHTGISATYDDAGDGAVDLSLTSSGVTAASYGSVTAVGTFTVDAYGRLTAAADATIAIPSTAVTDFTEATQDVSGAQLATNGSHTGITATYDDAGDGAIDLALVTENVQDISGAQLATNGSHSGITATYDDAGDGAIDLKVTEVYDGDGDSKIHWDADDVLSFTFAGSEKGSFGVDSVTFTQANAAFGETLTLWETGGGAGPSPKIDLKNDSNSAANDDQLGQINFYGNDSGGSSASNENVYASITGVIQDASASGEDGIIRSAVSIAGTMTTIADVMESGVNLATGKGILVNGTSILTSTSLAATVVLADGVAATTQSADDNSTKVATTAYVDTGLNALSSNSITDADGDTKIQVEESSDEDIIRFDTAGTERMTIGATGTVTITGDLTVNGTTTEISSTTITVDDKNIELGAVASPDDTTADGGGITLKGASDKTWNWVNSTDAWTSSEHIALATGKSVYIDGVIQLSKNSLAATVVLADGVTATTQAADDNTTKVATTAYVQTELAALSSDSISDADSDTKIQVEESSDEDKIRFDIGGTETEVIDSAGVDVTGNVVYNTALSAQTASYTFVLADRGKLVTVSNGSAVNCTVPPNSSVAYAVGTSIMVAQTGAGQVTMVAGSGVTLRSSPGLKLRAQYSSCTCTKIATDEWLLTGDLDD